MPWLPRRPRSVASVPSELKFGLPARVGTAAAGIAYRLPSGLDLFSSVGSQTGRDDHQASLTAGLRLRF
jgi:hypothetical protein